MMKGRYPQAVLFITMDPSKVDVNVHPAKQEVRFRSGQNVFRGIATAVDRALKGSSPVSYSEADEGRGVPTFPPAGVNFVSEPPHRGPGLSGSQGPLFPPTPSQPLFQEDSRVIGQLGTTYILCEVSDGFVLVDQHAAHERIVYEGLKKSYAAARVEAQEFLVPYDLELSNRDAGIVARRTEQLQRLGIHLEHFGGNTFLLRSVPALLGNAQWDTLITDLAGELERGTVDDQVLLDNVLTVMACHGAVRAGERMSMEEMSQLLDQLRETELPTNCPHGRPTFKHFTYGELERIFKRVV
jgi:DNA mismatch repair protein MutL